MTSRRSTARILTTVIAAAALAVPTAGTAAELTDLEISNAVDDELFVDTAVPHNRIDVVTTDGVVTLTGTANNLLAKQRAGTLASTVKGVRSVVNQIDVRPYWNLTDEEIEANVEEALLYDPATESWQIGVDVAARVATLTGTVDSWQERQLAETVASSVRGLTGVDNQIMVHQPAERSDLEIRTEVEEALRWDALVDHTLIDVTVTDGEVDLDGTVGSVAERDRAFLDAWVAGVDGVDDTGLLVRDWANDPDQRDREPVAVADAEIEDAVRNALLLDPRVLANDITVDVDDGFVTLRGSVETVRAKRAAASDARLTTGVAAVANRVKVRPTTTLTDAEVAAGIRAALDRNPFVERFDITVSVIDGTAYLSGTVDSYFEKTEADEAASRAAGVAEVRNQLRVDLDTDYLAWDPYLDGYPLTEYDWYRYEPYSTAMRDADIEAGIESELWWSPFVDSDEVMVTVEDGVATLTGTVDSWSERASATENAYEGGATWVDNDLDVR